MSFLGGLFGISSPQPAKQPEAESSAAGELFGNTTFRSNVSPQEQAAQQDSSFVPDSPSAPASAPEAPSSLAMLRGTYDAAALHPMANLGENLDFLALDENKLTEMDGAGSVLPSRGWTDDLCVGTGTTYLSGLVLGGAWGFKEGVSRPLGPNASARLRLNSVLNSCTRRGSFTGNSLGVLAIYYNIINSSLDAARDRHDIANSIAAGSLAGGIYKCTAGLRPALVGATIGGATMTVWSLIKNRI